MCTDWLEAYRAVVPEERHDAAGKEGRADCPNERFWCAFRQRLARFTRKTLSYSKCEWNHDVALWDFIRHYNASLL